MVGQRLITLLSHHPFFEIKVLAASAKSAGLPYREAVGNRWCMDMPIPEEIADIPVTDAEDVDKVSSGILGVFCAVSLEKEKTRALEEAYAGKELIVLSNNSACRGVGDVPMLIPEINPGHLEVLPTQRKRLGTKRGCIITKPNCSIQSYVTALTPLLPFGITKVAVATYQAVSGAGKTLQTFPHITDNVIPYIAGEEAKSEEEPKKIWGWVEDGEIQNAWEPCITAHCFRVGVSDGHLAAVSVGFRHKPTKEAILDAWKEYQPLKDLSLPSAPRSFLSYREEPDRPQPLLDRMSGGGMGIVLGRLREDPLFHWKFAGLSHNTLRGAAGGSVLTAEYLYRTGYFD